MHPAQAAAQPRTAKVSDLRAPGTPRQPARVRRLSHRRSGGCALTAPGSPQSSAASNRRDSTFR
eukprot:689268-Alexandrium_andersonii.AAC.1